MTVMESVAIMWESMQKGVYYPEALSGKLTLDEAYQVQLGVLACWVAAGEKQAGWKIGLTADAVRGIYSVTDPVFGYLLESGHFASGNTLQYDAIINPAIESELCFTLGQPLKGPGVTRAHVLAAIEAIAPAFEVVALRGNMAADLPLGVADNVSQWGYVTGPMITPYPQHLDLGEVVVEVTCNGETVSQGRGAEVIDNQLHSIAWLANRLADFDVALDAGQRIMSGSFTKPLPITKGDQWETRFSSVGTVAARFV